MKAAIYTRVSTEEQVREGISLAMQEERCKAAALAAGDTQHPGSYSPLSGDGRSRTAWAALKAGTGGALMARMLSGCYARRALS